MSALPIFSVKRLRQLLSFATVGGAATAAHWAITAGAVQALGWPPLLASSLGFVLSATFNFWANGRYTFAAGGLRHGQALRFALVALGGLACNVLALALGLQLGLPLLLAQPVATLVVLFWNFILNALWVFRPAAAATAGARAKTSSDVA